jgi:phospholipase C
VRMSGKNVGDLLNEQGITWGWFQGGFAPTQPATFNPDGSLKTPAVCGSTHAGHPGVPNPTGTANPNGLDIHGPVTDYSAHHAPFQYYASTGNPHHLRPTAAIGQTDQANHQYDLTDFFDALARRDLPAVSFLKAASFQDGHPGNSDPLSEQTFLVEAINALQGSDQWESTAVIIAWDDSDGWFDHVTGPIVNPSAGAGVDFFAAGANCGTPPPGAFQARCGYGPRLPLLVVSPWAKENHVDHNVTDQASILRFIEDNWGTGLVDGPAAPPKGQSSFDRLAGTIEGMFDFRHRRENRRLILDPSTGLVVDRDDRHAER